MKNIDELYKEWCGESHITNSCHPVHDSAEACDFAEYYHKQMEEYARLSEPEVVKVGEVLDVLDENLHYYKGDDGENHIDMLKLAHAVNDYYKSKTPISEPEVGEKRKPRLGDYYESESVGKWEQSTHPISESRIEELWVKYRYHLVHTDAMDEAGFKAAINELKQ